MSVVATIFGSFCTNQNVATKANLISTFSRRASIPCPSLLAPMSSVDFFGEGSLFNCGPNTQPLINVKFNVSETSWTLLQSFHIR